MLQDPAAKTPTVSEQDEILTVAGENFRYAYDRRRGLFRRMEYGGHALLDRPMELNVWRAPTDNDRIIRMEWERAHYDWMSARAYDTSWTVADGAVLILSHLALSAPTVQPLMRISALWTIRGSGAVDVRLEVEKDPEFPELPRFGLRLFLPKELDLVEYCGMGPQESYCDKHRATCHGLFAARVPELHEDYIRPQENGSHFDCDYVTVSGGGIGLTAVSQKPFCFNASPYTQEELTQKAHNYELEPCGSTVLCLDYAQNGIGSNSCGPRLLKRYRFDQTAFTFVLRLLPMAR